MSAPVLRRRPSTMRLVVHIGTHKTGSTIIQSTLVKNRRALRDRGVLFPMLGGLDSPKGHKAVSDHYRRIGAGGASPLPSLLSSEAGCHSLILSCENLYTLDRRAIEALGADAGDAACAVVCFLREPVGHLVSMWQQLLKGKGLHQDFEAFMLEQSLLLATPAGYYRYDDRVADWRARFPLRVVRHEKRGAREQIGAFLQAADLDPAIAGDLVPAAKANRSLDPAQAAFLWSMNRQVASGLLTAARREAALTPLLRGTLDLSPVLDHARWTTVRTRGFLDAFRAANPAQRGLLDASSEEVIVPAASSDFDRAVRDVISG